MSEVPDSKELLKKVDELLEDEGKAINKEAESNIDTLDKFILPGLFNSKNTLSSLYKFIPKEKKGIKGKLRNLIIWKIKGVVLNTVERESMRQQKFNELSYKAFEALVNENKELTKKIKELEDKLK